MIGPADAFASDAFDTPALRADGNGEHPYAIVLIGLTGRRVTAGDPWHNTEQRN